MTHRLPIKSGLLALALGLAFSSAHADVNLLSDGDFESFSGMVTNGGYATVAAPGNLGAWTIGGNSVDLIQNAYGAITNISVDVSGTPGPGSLSQGFMAQAGYTYTLTFDHFQNAPGTDLMVSFGDQNVTYAVPAAITTSTLTWTAATSGVQTVTFSGGSSNNGPTLDNVVLTVTAVPEPSTVALMFAGAGVIGFVARRRRSV